MGVDLERGVDAAACAWAQSGAPTTYHFLDLNLEESDDLDPAWIVAAGALARELGAAWLCGDAGLWHVGPRDRGHGVLLPPVLSEESAHALARNVRTLREASGLEVLPENPPAHVYAGPLHILDYFARVAEWADAGLLLDVAHLAIYQRAMGHAPLDGLDGFPLDRVVEVHVAGGTEFEHGGRRFVDDDHAPEPLADTWDDPRCGAAARAQPARGRLRVRAQSARAGTAELRAAARGGRRASRQWSARARVARIEVRPIEIDASPRVRRVQRALVRMQHDVDFAARIARGEPGSIASARLDAVGTAWLRALDPITVAADRDGKRAAQLLRNVGSEFRLCVAVGPTGDGDAFTRAFPRSEFFHTAIANDASLPLAFAAFADTRATGATPLFRALLALEAAMARARRRDTTEVSPPPATLWLSDAAQIVEVPAGTFAAATLLGERLDRGAPRGALPAVSRTAHEAILIVADRTADARFGRLRPLRVEPLETSVAAFLQRAHEPLDAAACAAFAEAYDVAPGALAAVVAEYVAEGVLVRGAGAP